MRILQKFDRHDRDLIRSKLIEHNTARLPQGLQTSKQEICFHLEDAAGEMIGGVAATMYWQHVHIDFFWVCERLRYAGWGSRLLAEVEQYARAHECRLVVLDTLSFQAPDFYRKNGYEIFGVLEDHPPGFTQYFLQKRL